MIVLNLECSRKHTFEGWFASSDAFAQQSAGKLVACPVCGCTEIQRKPSAPYVQARTVAKPPTADTSSVSRLAQLVSRMREAAATAEDVGQAFAEEARKIHYGDAPDRTIRGQATRDEVTELIDEGIGVLPVPAAKEDLH
ncbi:DUF1178 family protein [Nitrogeniibacter mangrovi]|uniref:DUF1178 family protein n=1 Tax=Nitrogeniibacter mangrovi TaxID=2016596 RepID=A0A6C1B661_9RHOO|nr:DUF1178 family protein [Nitrogeniibacter mangrovi]QID17780.1 DUF1178 family protein [Nitrogeniibacter mangrovi]